MIEKINTSIQNSNQTNVKRQQPQFKGGPVDLLLKGLQSCEANPMLNVTVLDLSTAIIPRTVIEGQTNLYAGAEALRRESSGLVINCLIPGFIVAGIAKAFQTGIMGGPTKMADCWANEQTIDLVKHHWAEANGANTRDKIEATFRNILNSTEGAKDNTFVKFADHSSSFDDSIKAFANCVENGMDKSAFNKAFESIVKTTEASDNIRIKGFAGEKGNEIFSQGLKSVLENTTKMLSELKDGRDVDVFAANAKKLLARKSILGMGLILPLAIAAQPINRWITEKTSGKKGAPIYKDFQQAKHREISQKDKAELLKQKVISVSSIVGVAMLSIMKKPSFAMLKNIGQFKGIFPSMDQARVISTATFASRMAASQDKNDLREATSRDIATFCSFYFLGDYVAKGIAKGIEKATKGKVKLINQLNEVSKEEMDKKNVLKKFWHWAKDTSMKSSDELINNPAAKKYRSLCQLGNIGFSLVALGLVIPKMYRKKTEKEHEKEMMQMATAK